MQINFRNGFGFVVAALLFAIVSTSHATETNEETAKGTASFTAEGAMQGEFDAMARVLLVDGYRSYMMIQITDNENFNKGAFLLEFIVQDKAQLGLPPTGVYEPVDGMYAQDGYNGKIDTGLRLRVSAADAKQYQAAQLESIPTDAGSVEITHVENGWVHGRFDVKLKQNGSINGGDIGKQQVHLFNGSFKAPLKPDARTW